VLYDCAGVAGRVDEMSMHGGCPVLSGTKWAANLWVWNGPRCEYTAPFSYMCVWLKTSNFILNEWNKDFLT
jgi:hypothetical protein